MIDCLRGAKRRVGNSTSTNGIIVYLNYEEMMIDLSNINVILPREGPEEDFMVTISGYGEGKRWNGMWHDLQNGIIMRSKK